MTVKRLFDLCLTIPALLVLMPVIGLISLWIKWQDGGAIFFRQQRVGKEGVLFDIYKFRTMCEKKEKTDRNITVGNDPRITPCGTVLRKYKIDELPQLFNVILGDMSLVGPRPEVPEYVKHWSKSDKKIVLSVRPGLTDYAAIEYIDEAALLRDSSNPHKTYIEKIIPAKIVLYKKYVANFSLATDISLIFRTLKKIVQG